MEWLHQLRTKERRGSRPRCVLLMDGSRDEVAEKLTGLINVPDVVVNTTGEWIPWGKPVEDKSGKWDRRPASEAQLHKADSLLNTCLRTQLRDWWLAVSRNAATPNWDIASTCSIDSKPGLLLVEAKAHAAELARKSDRCGSSNDENRERIRLAISQATEGLHVATEGPWNLSRDHHYQMSNRFAWAWKLASLGVPVVLMYLGFLNARDMAGKELFKSMKDWESSLKEYGNSVVDNGCWGQRLDIDGTPMLPLIRACEQPFYP